MDQRFVLFNVFGIYATIKGKVRDSNRTQPPGKAKSFISHYAIF